MCVGDDTAFCRRSSCCKGLDIGVLIFAWVVHMQHIGRGQTQNINSDSWINMPCTTYVYSDRWILAFFVAMENCSGQYFTTTYSEVPFYAPTRGVRSTPYWSMGHTDDVEALLSVCL